MLNHYKKISNQKTNQF